jgi:D-arabinose 1-dehydrogenase-like Zn-dependent alcohol dehydrogenase
MCIFFHNAFSIDFVRIGTFYRENLVKHKRKIFVTLLNFQKRGQMGGSLIGGIQETQKMLDFCAKHHITSDVEIISIQKINEAYERMLKSDGKYRFVIDMASLQGA